MCSERPAAGDPADRAPVSGDESTPTAGVAFAALPDPFEPLAAIEATGYASLEWIGQAGAARGTVMLVCPTY